MMGIDPIDRLCSVLEFKTDPKRAEFIQFAREYANQIDDPVQKGKLNIVVNQLQLINSAFPLFLLQPKGVRLDTHKLLRAIEQVHPESQQYAISILTRLMIEMSIPRVAVDSIDY